MKKDARVEIRMTQTERTKVQKLADRSGMTVSELIRNFINHGVVHPRPTVDFHEFTKELRRIGSNLNQVSALANTKGFIDVVRLNSLMEELWNLEQQAGDLFRRAG